MTILQNIGYILIGFIAIISIFLIILTLLEKKLQIAVQRGRHYRNEYYIGKIAKIKTENPKSAIKELDEISKAFFREAFNIQSSIENSQMENFFIEKNNRKASQFSSQMTKFLYSKEEITKEQIQELIILLAEIIGSNKIITKAEKEELDRKSKKNDSSQKKLNFKEKIKKLLRKD